MRDEVTLHPGPPALDHSPTWTLRDPARHRFFRVGWTEQVILTRWHLGLPDGIVAAVNQETPLRITPEQVFSCLRFLENNDLLRHPGEGAWQRLYQKKLAQRQGLATWLLHNYLFFKVPLVQPQAFLLRTLPFMAWAFSRTFWLTIGLSALTGLYLVGRQWESFLATFSFHFSWEGMLWFGIALSMVKVAHELGHAYTACRFGCRVPTMGVAFLVMWPMLYTETSDVWRLTKRRHRMAVVAAGVLTELALAALATLSWSFLEDGPARSALFFLATASWTMALLFNLSPFMRFDGFFLFSDWLGFPNLHDRAGALGRWGLRRILLGVREPEPEPLPRRRRNFLIGFAYTTWLYRFFLFLGIALTVYHFFFKLAGIFLMVVEVGWFIVRPIWNELMAWRQRLPQLGWNRSQAVTWGVLLALLFLLIVPWHGQITLPAVLKRAEETVIYATESGRLLLLPVKDGDRVRQGDLLIRLASPDLEFQLDQNRQKIEALEWELGRQGMDPHLLERNQEILQELEAELAAYQGNRHKAAKMILTAPHDGEIELLDEEIQPGDWIKEGAPLLAVSNPGQWRIETFVREADLRRIALGNVGQFHPEKPFWPIRLGQIAKIDPVGTLNLQEHYLASTFGGDIPVREAEKGRLVPVQSVYRVILAPDPAITEAGPTLRGQVVVQGRAESLLIKWWQSAMAIVIRESGF